MKKGLIVLTLILGMCMFPRIVHAAELQQEDIVVLLDCSQSMKDVDEQHMAYDYINGLAAVLPSRYRLGLVGYNEEIVFSVPLGGDKKTIESVLSNAGDYTRYGNAGLGLESAVSLFDDKAGRKRILILSDGENLMKTEEGIAESVRRYNASIDQAIAAGITVDIINLGEKIEDTENLYAAAERTGGEIYVLENGDTLPIFMEEYLFRHLGIAGRPVGRMDGTEGELNITLPDCMMETAKIVLVGVQDNDNLTVNGEAERITLSKGKGYTVAELQCPVSQEISIRIRAEEEMHIAAYVTAEYQVNVMANYSYDMEQGCADMKAIVQNAEGNNLLEGHMAGEQFDVLVNGKERQTEVRGEAILWKEVIDADENLSVEIVPVSDFADYYGDMTTRISIIVPVIPKEEAEEPEIDWFFWMIIIIFIVILVLLFLSVWKGSRKKHTYIKDIDSKQPLMAERGISHNDFYGKLQVYVIHNKDEIDFPPESVNLFARCNRDMITLDWLLETCNIPLLLRGADKIIFRPGSDRSVYVKNSGKATALKGRELLEKGRTYVMYYHDKVTFLFDDDEAEIEVHYKDLKPNER